MISPPVRKLVTIDNFSDVVYFARIIVRRECHESNAFSGIISPFFLSCEPDSSSYNPSKIKFRRHERNEGKPTSATICDKGSMVSCFAINDNGSLPSMDVPNGSSKEIVDDVVLLDLLRLPSFRTFRLSMT